MERARGGDVPSFSPQMYGKWYDIAIGTTCKWMKNYKEKFSMGTLVLGPGPSTDQISTASTRLRYGALPWILEPLSKPPHPGVLHLPGAGARHGGRLLWLASEPRGGPGLGSAQCSIPNASGRGISGVLCHSLGAPGMIFV